MRSRIPKVLHPLAGRPMIDHVLAALAAAGVERPVVVTGHGAERWRRASRDRAASVRQEPQLGTADAVRIGLGRIAAPRRRTCWSRWATRRCCRPSSSQRCRAEQAEGGRRVALALRPGGRPDRLRPHRARAPMARSRAIVEEADADEATRGLDEVNAGTYCFDAAWLRANVGRVPASPSGELLPHRPGRDGRRRAARRVASWSRTPRPSWRWASTTGSGWPTPSVWLQRQIAEAHMRNGVTIVDPRARPHRRGGRDRRRTRASSRGRSWRARR